MIHIVKNFKHPSYEVREQIMKNLIYMYYNKGTKQDKLLVQ